MKRKYLILPALSLALLFGCDSDRRTAQADGYQENGLAENEYIEEENGVLEESELERTSADALGEESRQFVIEASLGSMAEVEFGQLAQERAQQQEVKDLAQMLVQDHRQMNEALQNNLQNNPIEMPEFLRAEQQEKLQELQSLSGQEFDKEYVSMIVDMHEEAIDNFESMQEENMQSPELQSWVANSLPTLRKHYEQAKQLKERMESQQ